MTKKDFNELTDYHQYGKRNDSGVVALFFGWKSTDEGTGFSHCVYARALNSNKKELTNALFNLVTKNEDVPEYWINCAVIQNDKQRFKVPIGASGLRSLIKYQTMKIYKTELKPISQSELDEILKGSSLEQRITPCPECRGTEWWLLPKEGAAVREGGKPYCECLNCGYQTHL
jgi:hypothetical protein